MLVGYYDSMYVSTFFIQPDFVFNFIGFIAAVINSFTAMTIEYIMYFNPH